MNKQQPEALRLTEMLTADEWPGSVTLVSYAQECVAELLTKQARITELESQLAQRFDAADMATASAQGFRDGAAKEQQAGWQPIETAPTDGREILGYTEEFGALVMYWDTRSQEQDHWSDGMSTSYWMPTHWQPMPPPPSSTQREVSNG